MKARTRVVVFACLIWALATLFPFNTWAQTYNAEVIGRITDPQGAVVPGAQIKVLEQTKGTTFSTVSTSDGTYHIVGIVPGMYRLEVTMSGFQKAVVPDLELRPIAQKRVDVTLQVGTVTQSVQVTDVAPTIETQKSNVTVVAPKQMYDRPMTADSRGWAIESILWLPDSAPAGGWMLFGSGSAANQEFTFEGQAVTPILNVLSETTVQEMQVTTSNAPAEFARPVNLNVTFRGGTNNYHGNWEWTLKSACLNAINSPFTQAKRAPCTSVWYTLWGVGGPVRIPRLYDGRNKSFFYFSGYKWLPALIPTIYTPSAPSLQMQAGDFSKYAKVIKDPLTGQPFPGNIIPPNRINPVTKKYNDLAWGAGPGISYKDQTSYVFNARATGYYKGDSPLITLKFDQNIGQKAVVSFVKRDRPAKSYAFRNGPTVYPPRSWGWDYDVIHDYNLSAVYSFSPTVVNELRATVSRPEFGSHAIWLEPIGTPAPIPGQSGRQWLADLGIQGIPTAPDIAGMPIFNVSDWRYGPARTPGKNLWSQYQLFDNLSHKRGAHSLKIGWYSYHYAFDAQSTGPFWGQFDFDGRFSGEPFADFLLGYPGTVTKTVPRAWIARRKWELAAYAQDDWAVSPNLNLSLGFRWNTYTTPYDRNRMYYNFDLNKFALVVPDDKSLSMASPLWPTARLPVITAAQAGLPSRLFNQHHYFQPRFGFAYRPGGSVKTVIRGGYGVYSGRILFEQLQTAGPFQVAESFPNQLVSTPTGSQVQFQFPNPFVGGVGAPPAVLSATHFDIDFRAPVVQQANLTFERALSANWGLRATYMIVRTTQLLWTRDINQLKLSTTPYSQDRRPYPQWQTLAWAENGANDSYQSAQFLVSHRWADGLWAQASYQYRYNRGAPGGVYGYNRNYDWSRSGTFPTHDIVANWVWELPVGTGKKFWGDLSNRGVGGKLLNAVVGNWASTGAFSIHSGIPFNPTYTGKDPGNINLFSGRPDVVPGCDPYAGARDVHNLWFNPKCFAIPQPGTLGNTPRNSLVGPTTWAMLLSPYKDFPLRFLGEQAKIRLGATIHNLFNNPPYGIPTTDITSPLSGRILALLLVRTANDYPIMRSIMLRGTFEF